ncbi:protein ENHANCED DISEASE RESISTANCE 2-like [Cynara cardunculus var. scolymus]|uniref:protein ENHANCED DISEASE RESISTANCE 2-like n=1 Tax=Cynara cardunculus var. scolymus TaxID=59895 RepID=UPI000D6250D3|nr:protein ENHANCED DISEASE RESISTANCE 2-like [Cynara cardunculus var. scolymus]
MNVEAQRKEDIMGALDKAPSSLSIRGEKEEESDDYYSYSDSVEDTRSENSWSDLSPQEVPPPKFSLAVTFLKRLHGSIVQKRGVAPLEDIEWQDSFLSNNDSSFPNDPTGDLPNSWGAAESSSFQIRGETYLQDRKKITGKGTLMQLVAANMLRSTKKQDDFAGRPGSICQKFAAANCPDFFFIVNMQIPGPTTNFHIAFYYATTTPIKDVPLLQSFVEGDDAYRNARFKLIPHVSKGPWIVKQSVGNRPCLLGQVLKIHYARGKNYLELDVDVGSSMIAKKVANTVLSTFSHLIVEAAFLIQGNTREELPEHLLGTCRMSHIDISKVACT